MSGSKVSDVNGEGKSLGEEDSRTSIPIRASEMGREKIWVGGTKKRKKGKFWVGTSPRVGRRKGCRGQWKRKEKKIQVGKGEEEGTVLAPKKMKKSWWGHCKGLGRRTGCRRAATLRQADEALEGEENHSVHPKSIGSSGSSFRSSIQRLLDSNGQTRPDW